MIEINNLTKIYNGGKKAVDDITLKVNDGEIFAFIGHNGAGKTTTIKAMMGILNFEKGDILINGTSILNDPIKAKKQMAYLPDNPELYDNLSGLAFVNFICDIYEVDEVTRNKNIKKFSEMFEMQDHLSEEIASYSHGMKQKIALIAALSHNPKVIVLDEPFVGLDPSAVFDLKNVFKEMTKNGASVFFSTHILDVAEKLCDRVAIIKNGKIIAFGTMKDVKGNKSLENVFLELDKENTK